MKQKKYLKLEWKIVNLEEILANQKYAIVDGPFGSNLKQEHYRENGVHIIQSGFVTSNKFIAKKYQYVEETLFNEQKRSKVISGDIVMAKIGAQSGTCAILPDCHPDSIIASNCLKISVNKSICINKYLLYYLHYLYSLNGLADIKSITAQPAISISQIKKLKILLPPLAEQKKIAEILTTWDEAIALTEKAINVKKKRKKFLIKALLSEEKWEKVNQGSVVTFYNGRAYKLSEWETNGTPVIRLQNLTGRSDTYYYSNLTLPEHQYVNYGDLLYMWSATFGPHIWQGDKAIYHYHIWKVVCSEKIKKMYLYYLLDHLTQSWMSSTNGMGLLHLTKETMEKQKIPLPPSSEQIAIAEILMCADREIELTQNKLNILKQQKRGLMQKLLTGEWPVIVTETND